MSEQEPKDVYVYQPHPMFRKDGRLWQVSGWPNGMTREEATAIADVANYVLSLARLEEVIQSFATQALPNLPPCWCEQITIGDDGHVEHDDRCRSVTDAFSKRSRPAWAQESGS